MTARQIIGECFALLCALMLGLAAGAVWLLPAVFLDQPLPWLAIPAGWLLALAIRQWVHRRRGYAVALAVIATAAACIYIRVLICVANLSAMLGYGLVDSMRTAGPSMLLDLARLSVGASDVFWSIVGIGVAAIFAARVPRRAKRSAA